MRMPKRLRPDLNDIIITFQVNDVMSAVSTTYMS